MEPADTYRSLDFKPTNRELAIKGMTERMTEAFNEDNIVEAQRFESILTSFENMTDEEFQDLYYGED